MADDKKNDNTQGQIHNNDFGTIRVDDEVVASVVAITMNNIDGIANSTAVSTDGFIGNVTDSLLGKKNGIKGIKVEFKNDGFYIAINIKVKYGYCISDLAHEFQRAVKTDVEKMTGMKVHAVDIFVQGIDFSNLNDLVMGDQHA